MKKEFEIKGLKVEGHRGTWYNVSEGREYVINDKKETVYIFEHETYGGEAPHIIANEDGVRFMGNVWQGWVDWKEHLLDEQGYDRADFPLVIEEPMYIWGVKAP